MLVPNVKIIQKNEEFSMIFLVDFLGPKALIILLTFLIPYLSLGLFIITFQSLNILEVVNGHIVQYPNFGSKWLGKSFIRIISFNFV
jgi:hypothetical protein